MKEKYLYVITIIAAILLLVIGHFFAVQNIFVLDDLAHEVIVARVERITERERPFDDFAEFGNFGEFAHAQSYHINFEARAIRGIRKGDLILASQSFTGFLPGSIQEIKEGDTVLLIHTNIGWFFNGFLRTNKLIVFGLLFIVCVIIFGGKKGFNTIISLGLTIAAVFLVFIPSILSGKNIYIMALFICIYTTVMTLTIVIGFNKKALAAAIGCLSGIVIAGILTLIYDNILLLTGMVDEHSRHLVNLPLDTPINLKAIIFAGIIIGAMGAIMDVAMSISSALWELKEKTGTINFETMFRSGITIGRDIFGTMANTLVLAYIGTSLSLVLLLSVYSNSLLDLFNMEMIVVEVLKTLAGCFGILFTMPLTAFFCSVIYVKD